MKELAILCSVCGLLCGVARIIAGNDSWQSGSVDNSLMLHKESEAIEHCGVDAVYACLRYFHMGVRLSDVSKEVSPGIVEDGMSVAKLQELLHGFALHSKLVWGTPDRLGRWLNKGCVGIVPNSNNKHFYVYLRQRGQEYFRYNPPYGYGWVPSARVKADWDGMVVVVNPEPIGKAENSWLAGLTGIHCYIIYLLGAAAAMFGLVALWLWNSNRKQLSGT